MGLKRWLLGERYEQEDAGQLVAPGEQVLLGLDLKTVLDSHSAWKKRLTDVLATEAAADLDVAEVGQDNQCALGKWLHGPAKQQFGKLPEYQEALKAHARFHVCAAEVLVEHDAGNADKAAELLRKDFRQASNNNQLHLVKLFMDARHGS